MGGKKEVLHLKGFHLYARHDALIEVGIKKLTKLSGKKVSQSEVVRLALEQYVPSL